MFVFVPMKIVQWSWLWVLWWCEKKI